MELKEAIEHLKDQCKFGLSRLFTENDILAIDTVLEELDKKDKLYNKALIDLVKAEKVIDLMVKELAIPGISIERMNLYNNVSPDKPIWQLIKEYFYKKVEGENE